MIYWLHFDPFNPKSIKLFEKTEQTPQTNVLFTISAKRRVRIWSRWLKIYLNYNLNIFFKKSDWLQRKELFKFFGPFGKGLQDSDSQRVLNSIKIYPTIFW